MERLKNRSIRLDRMISSITRVCLLLLVLAIFSASAVQASLGHGDVRYEDGRVTVKGYDLNAMDLLEQISRVANVRIFIFDSFIPKRISLDIEERPLEMFIRSVLNGHSFAVLYFCGDLSGIGADFDSYTVISTEPLKQTGTYIPGVEVSKGDREEQEKRTETTRKVLYGEGVTSRLSVPESGKAGQAIQGGVVLWEERERSWLGHEGVGSALGAGQVGFSAGESAMVAEIANPAELNYEQTGIPDPVRFPDTPGLTGREELLVRIEYLKGRIASGESDAFYNKWEPIKGQYVTHDKVLLEHYEQRLGQDRRY